MFRASLGSEHTQDSSTASNIQHCLSFEQMGIVDDSGAVGARSYGVFQHLLVNTWRIEDRVSETTTIENVHELTEMRIGIGIAGRIARKRLIMSQDIYLRDETH
jgi:hypothetical protein